MMYGSMILYEVSLLFYQKTTNSEVKINLASVINNCVGTTIVIKAIA